MRKKRALYPLLMIVGLGAALVSILIGVFDSDEPKVHEADFSAIETSIVSRKVTEATIFDRQHRIEVRLADGSRQKAQFVAEAGDELQERLRANGTPFKVVSNELGWFSRNVDTLIILALLGTFLFGGIARVVWPQLKQQLGLSKAKYLAERPKERFSDVKGADEAVKIGQLIVDSLKDPEKFKHLKVPRGILVHGPTGTGKTLWAKAVAGEAGVPFHRAAGAGLTSHWANGTAELIGDFFDQIINTLGADKNTAAVVFLDEIDGIASKRTGDDDSDRDTNTSVTQLLDRVGRLLEEYPNVVMIGATNRFDSLDDAMKREGRLGTHIAMPNPPPDGRVQILKQNSDGLQLSPEVLRGLASLTRGLSGASLAGIPKNAAVVAYMEGGLGTDVTPRHLEFATIQTVVGTLRKSAEVVPEDEQIACVHESGHSTVAHASPFHQLRITTSIPAQDNGGSTWMPMHDRGLLTEDAIMWQLGVIMGGREAERLYCETASTGGGHDIQNATNLALAAVCQWGLFGFSMSVDVETWCQHPDADRINSKVQELLSQATAQAKAALVKYEEFCRAVQAGLAEHRILYSDQLAELGRLHQPGAPGA